MASKNISQEVEEHAGSRDEGRPILPSPSYQQDDSSHTSEPLPSYGATTSSHSHTPFRRIDPEINEVPEYVERPDPIFTLRKALFQNQVHDQQLDLAAWAAYSSSLYREDAVKSPSGTALVNDRLVECFFTAVDAGQEDVVKFVLSEGILDANTMLQGTWIIRPDINKQNTFIGQTPLIRAVKSRKVAVVRLLLDMGAHVDAFSTTVDDWEEQKREVRTPLQLAASMGHFILVKLLMEEYHASDDLVAPDGQIALRLAAENGHTEIVNYLPSRRAGGFRRWKFKNRASIARAKRAAKKIGYVVKFFVWDIEKFFLWTTPKHLLVLPVVEVVRWCWKNKGKLGPWLKKQILLMPGRLRIFGNALLKIPKAIWNALSNLLGSVWRGLVKLPPMIWRFLVATGKAVWKFGTKTLPSAIKHTCIWIWKFLTVRIPRALGIAGKWLWQGIVSFASGIWHIVLKLISLIATLVSAVITFFQNLTLQDIWNGIVDVLRAIFVSLPQKLFSWAKKLVDVTYNFMKALFGVTGEVLWFIGAALLWLVVYLPGQVWKIFQSLGESLGKAMYELRVWIDPKAR